MAQYRVLKTSYIDGRLREEGEIIEYTGKAGSNLEPLDRSGRKARAQEAAPVQDQTEA